jgi:hypothetical protein
MPAERLSMRQIREVLRLCFESRLPQRAVARSLGLGQGTVSGYLSRARATGIAWPLPEDLDDARLEALLFPPPSSIPADQRPMPDWGWVHRELRRPDQALLSAARRTAACTISEVIWITAGSPMTPGNTSCAPIGLRKTADAQHVFTCSVAAARSRSIG